MEELTAAVINGGFVAAFLEALKKALGARFDWSRFGGLLALAVGVVTACAGVQLGWYPTEVTMGQAVYAGLTAGIFASGLNRGVTQNPPTVVVQGDLTAARPAAPPSAPPATAVIENPTVTDDAGAAGVSRSLGESRPIARLAQRPPDK